MFRRNIGGCYLLVERGKLFIRKSVTGLSSGVTITDHPRANYQRALPASGGILFHSVNNGRRRFTLAVIFDILYMKEQFQADAALPAVNHLGGRVGRPLETS